MIDDDFHIDFIKRLKYNKNYATFMKIKIINF